MIFSLFSSFFHVFLNNTITILIIYILRYSMTFTDIINLTKHLLHAVLKIFPHYLVPARAGWAGGGWARGAALRSAAATPRWDSIRLWCDRERVWPAGKV